MKQDDRSCAFRLYFAIERENASIKEGVILLFSRLAVGKKIRNKKRVTVRLPLKTYVLCTAKEITVKF